MGDVVTSLVRAPVSLFPSSQNYRFTQRWSAGAAHKGRQTALRAQRKPGSTPVKRAHRLPGQKAQARELSSKFQGVLRGLAVCHCNCTVTVVV